MSNPNQFHELILKCMQYSLFVEGIMCEEDKNKARRAL